MIQQMEIFIKQKEINPKNYNNKITWKKENSKS